MSEDHPKYFIIEIGQNTENSPGDLRRFENPVKDDQLTLMRKTLKGIANAGYVVTEIKPSII